MCRKKLVGVQAKNATWSHHPLLLSLVSQLTTRSSFQLTPSFPLGLYGKHLVWLKLRGGRRQWVSSQPILDRQGCVGCGLDFLPHFFKHLPGCSGIECLSPLRPPQPRHWARWDCRWASALWSGAHWSGCNLWLREGLWNLKLAKII